MNHPISHLVIVFILLIGCAPTKPQGTVTNYEINFDDVENLADLEEIASDPNFQGPGYESAMTQIPLRVQANSEGNPCPVGGRVIVTMVIGENGIPISPQVVQGIHPRCDEIALKSVSETLFGPATLNGEPVRIISSVPVVFD